MDITIGGLRQQAYKAKDRISTNPKSAAVNLAFVGVMTLIQIAQEANEIKDILANRGDNGDAYIGRS